MEFFTEEERSLLGIPSDEEIDRYLDVHEIVPIAALLSVSQVVPSGSCACTRTASGSVNLTCDVCEEDEP